MVFDHGSVDALQGEYCEFCYYFFFFFKKLSTLFHIIQTINIFHRLNMYTLVSLGTSIAYFYSLIAVIFPNIFPDTFRDNESREIVLFFDAAALIIEVHFCDIEFCFV